MKKIFAFVVIILIGEIYLLINWQSCMTRIMPPINLKADTIPINYRALERLSSDSLKWSFINDTTDFSGPAVSVQNPYGHPYPKFYPIRENIKEPDTVMKPILLKMRNGKWWVVKIKNGAIADCYPSDTMPYFKYNWIIFDDFLNNKDEKAFSRIKYVALYINNTGK